MPSREHPADPVEPSATRQRWEILESRFGERIRESDAAWARSLPAAERLALLDDLLDAVRAAHAAAGDWPAVEAQAWQETLAERRLLLHAFRRLDEVTRGRTPLADAC
jgi:hypothetical protein